MPVPALPGAPPLPRAIRTLSAALWLSCALGLAPVHAASAPRHVMSIYLCADQLLLELLPPSRISSVTYLSREPYESFLAAQAARVPVNRGSAEEVVRQRPDLVIAGTYTTPATRALIRRVGIPLLELPPANDFAQIRAVTLEVGRAVGALPRAEALVARMDATLAALAAQPLERPVRLLAWDGSGAVPGRGSLFDAIVSAAGAVNVGAAAGKRNGHFDVEALLAARPDLIAVGDATLAEPTLGLRTSAPLLSRLFHEREITYPELLYGCGLPQSAQAAVQMRQAMLRAMGRSVPPGPR
jgi:iron complex transport system substrate-binding protein